MRIPSSKIKRSAVLMALLAVTAMVVASGCRRRRHRRHRASDPRRVLSGPEIRTLFAGKTVQGDHLKKHYYFRSYYDPKGTFRSYQQGAKTPTQGKWRVRGNEICVQWQNTPSELCRQMVVDSNGAYWKVKVKPDGRKINIVMFKTFMEGNKADPASAGAAGGGTAAGTAAGSGEPAGAGAAAATTGAGSAAGGTAGGAPPAAATKGGKTPVEKPAH